MDKQTAQQIIEDPITCLERIITTYNEQDFLITPIGIDCYSSFVAKATSSYIPSIFGFRNTSTDFICNYLEAAQEDSYFNLIKGLVTAQKKLDICKFIEPFRDTNIHSLQNLFGMFLLNHDGGKCQRPYTKQILNEEVSSRLTYLDLVTYAYFYKLKPQKRRIVVLSGSHHQKIKISSAIKNNASKFIVNHFEILFLHTMKPLNGESKPIVKRHEDQINIQFFKEHKDYGNVNANWNSIKDQIVELAKTMIDSNCLPIIE